MLPKTSNVHIKHENKRNQSMQCTTTQQMVLNSATTTQYNQQNSVKTMNRGRRVRQLRSAILRQTKETSTKEDLSLCGQLVVFGLS